MKRWILAFVVVLAIGAKADAADCLLGDADNNGAVSIGEVQQCVSNFLGGSNPAGCTGPQGSSGPQGPPGPIGPGLVVRDANDVLVGAVYNISGVYADALLGASPFPYPTRIQAGQNSLAGYAEEVWFESSDCTGTPFLRSGDLPLMVVPSASVGGTLLYYATAATPTAHQLHSQLTAAEGCRPLTQSFSALPSETFDLSTRFTPPYRVVTP